MRCVVFAIALAGAAAPAVAQDDRGATAAGSVGVTSMDSRTELSYVGTFGYRFSRVIGIELEATLVPAVKSPFAAGGPVVIQNYTTTATPAIVQIYPPPTYTNPGGRAVIFSTNAHIDIPTITTRVTPYFVAGGGVASVRRTAEYVFPVPLATGAPQGSLIPVPIPRPVLISSSVTDLALTLGGGLDVGVISRLSIEVDLRYFRLLGEQDQNVGRFGVGARYRF